MMLKCDSCGKFMAFDEPGSSHLFVPDSEVSREEVRDRCAECTEKHGAVISEQSGVFMRGAVLPK